MPILENLIQPVSDFIFVSHPLGKADIIFIPGSEDPAPCLAAAALFKIGLAPLILPSGKYSVKTGAFAGDPAYQTEWAFMRAVLIQHGVTPEAVLKEDQATFTMENAVFSSAVVRKMGIRVKKSLLVCKAFHARRALMYYQFAFPGVEIRVHGIPSQGISRDNWFQTSQGIQQVLGELERIGGQFPPLFEERRFKPKKEKEESARFLP